MEYEERKLYVEELLSVIDKYRHSENGNDCQISPLLLDLQRSCLNKLEVINSRITELKYRDELRELKNKL